MAESKKASEETERVRYKAIKYRGETYMNIIFLSKIMNKFRGISSDGVKRLYDLSKEHAIDISENVKG